MNDYDYNFTDRAKKVLFLAQIEASSLGHRYVGTEHILLGLIREGEGLACAVLDNLLGPGNLEKVRAEILYLLVQPSPPSSTDANGV